MAQAILSALLNFIIAIVNVVLTPINLLIANLFPDFSTMLTNFNDAILILGGNAMKFITTIIRFFPIFSNCIVIYLTFLITYYTISISAHAILKIWKVIKAIKIW